MVKIQINMDQAGVYGTPYKCGLM